MSPSKEYSRDLALNDLSTQDVRKVCRTLVGIAFCESDWRWAQNKFLEFLDSDNSDIKGVSAICFGHLARIHGCLDIDKVIPALEKYLHDESVRGQILDAFDDIKMFCSNSSGDIA